MTRTLSFNQEGALPPEWATRLLAIQDLFDTFINIKSVRNRCIDFLA